MPPPASAQQRRKRIITCLQRKICLHQGLAIELITGFTPLGQFFEVILSDVVLNLTGKLLKNYGSMNAGSSFKQAVDFLMTVVQN